MADLLKEKTEETKKASYFQPTFFIEGSQFSESYAFAAALAAIRAAFAAAFFAALAVALVAIAAAFAVAFSAAFANFLAATFSLCLAEAPVAASADAELSGTALATCTDVDVAISAIAIIDAVSIFFIFGTSHKALGRWFAYYRAIRLGMYHRCLNLR